MLIGVQWRTYGYIHVPVVLIAALIVDTLAAAALLWIALTSTRLLAGTGDAVAEEAASQARAARLAAEDAQTTAEAAQAAARRVSNRVNGMERSSKSKKSSDDDDGGDIEQQALLSLLAGGFAQPVPSGFGGDGQALPQTLAEESVSTGPRFRRKR